MAGDLLNGEIPGHWELLTLGEVCNRGGGTIQAGPFGSQLHASDYVPMGIPSIMPTNIGDNRINEDGIVRITEEDATRLGRHRVKAGDIVYSRRGDVEKRALIRQHEEGWLCGTGCLKVRLGSGIVDPLYASLFLGHPALKEWIVRHAIGATMPNLNTSIMSAVPFALPPLSEQKRIAEILGSLDDKIELNRQMNETLEAMARALFQSWFVDFDPVRAKLDGRKPVGLDAETTALFPAAFRDSPLGPIPKGWGVGSIYEIADVIYGAPFASKLFNPNGDGKPLIRIRDLADESPGVWTPEVHPKGYTVRPGDIVVGMDGEFRAYLWGGTEAWLNQRVCVFAPKSVFSAAFVRNSILDPLAQVEATETATTVIHIGKNDIDRFKVVIPDEGVRLAFSRLCQPWYDRIVANKQQSRTLAALRDALLPKLLSGEMDVSEIGKTGATA